LIHVVEQVYTLFFALHDFTKSGIVLHIKGESSECMPQTSPPGILSHPQLLIIHFTPPPPPDRFTRKYQFNFLYTQPRHYCAPGCFCMQRRGKTRLQYFTKGEHYEVIEIFRRTLVVFVRLNGS
jgi:hypothetical protein